MCRVAGMMLSSRSLWPAAAAEMTCHVCCRRHLRGCTQVCAAAANDQEDAPVPAADLEEWRWEESPDALKVVHIGPCTQRVLPVHHIISTAARVLAFQPASSGGPGRGRSNMPA